MTFADFFAGIGGIRLGLERAGLRCVWSCERDPFARAVYAARFGKAPESDDIETADPARIPAADLRAGGFPCQDLSVAGQRKGFAGTRSVLVYRFLDVAAAAPVPPAWLLLENVPGLLSVRRGRDFAALLAALDDRGYVGAWRVLDARFFGVPQRRRRVFLVARRAGAPGPHPAEVLLEPPGLRGRPAAGAEAREDVAKPLGCSASRGGGHRVDLDHGALIAGTVLARENLHHDERDTLVVHTLDSASGGACTEDGTGRGVPLVATLRASMGGGTSGHQWGGACVADTVTAKWARGTGGPAGDETQNLIAFHVTQDPIHDATVTPALSAGNRQGCATVAVCDLAQITHPANRTRVEPGRPSPIMGATNRLHAATAAQVRRLLPVECERLQGLPDGWTDIPGASDSARYRAIGNGVAVPVLTWIGRRLMGRDRGRWGGDGAP